MNKFLAKVASDINKPNGQNHSSYSDFRFLEELPIEKFYGIGKVTANKMYSLQIFKGKDLKAKSMEELARLFGKSGIYYYNVVRNSSWRSKTSPNSKSVGVEHTFGMTSTKMKNFTKN